MPDNFRHNKEIFADVMSPGELWLAVQKLKDEDFPVLVKYDGESVHLHDSVGARMFGLGVHFGGMAYAGMHDNPDF